MGLRLRRLYRQTAASHPGSEAGAATGNYSFASDEAGRLTSFTGPSGTPQPVESDPDSNRVRYGDRRLTHNTDGSIATETPPGGEARPYRYPVFGHVEDSGRAAF